MHYVKRRRRGRPRPGKRAQLAAMLSWAGRVRAPAPTCSVIIRGFPSTPAVPRPWHQPPTCSLIIRTLPPIPVAPRPTAVNNLPTSTRRAASETLDSAAELPLQNTHPCGPSLLNFAQPSCRLLRQSTRPRGKACLLRSAAEAPDRD